MNPHPLKKHQERIKPVFGDDHSDPDLFHDLWRHPAGRADERVPRLLPAEVAPGGQPRADAEVGYLDTAVLADQDVPRLDVPDEENRYST